jgi:hypothetical protein
LGKGTSSQLASNVIFIEVLLPKLRKGGAFIDYGGGMVDYAGTVNRNIDWAGLEMLVAERFPSLKIESVARAKPIYYEWLNDWLNFSKSVEFLKTHHSLSTQLLNQYAYRLLSSSNDPQVLKSALTWTDDTFELQDGGFYLGAYIRANLLYKLGEKEAAIRMHESTLKLGGENSQISDELKKMKGNEKIF